jgi:hypothetical protein
MISAPNHLAAAKRAWQHMPVEQRQEFLEWVYCANAAQPVKSETVECWIEDLRKHLLEGHKLFKALEDYRQRQVMDNSSFRIFHPEATE